MPSYSGVWTLPAQYQAIGGQNWPSGPVTGLFGGSSANSQTNVIEYINIASVGNATDFGDLLSVSSHMGACSSATRGIWAGGPETSPSTNVIQYVTIATVGNATDFGDLTAARFNLAGLSNSTRGVFGGGQTSDNPNVPTNIIDYVTIATTGDATDFGDLAVTNQTLASCASSTRGVFNNGAEQSFSAKTNTIQYVTIASTGNTTDFGDTLAAWSSAAACSNSTRGLLSAGVGNGDVFLNTINYITIATTGNATDFGDLIIKAQGVAACSSSTRGVFGGGNLYDGGHIYYNVIQYVTIATTGDATDFGDLTATTAFSAACSSGHGGL